MYYLPIENFKGHVVHSLFNLNLKMSKFRAEEVLTNEFIEYISRLDLEPRMVQIFSYLPGQNLGIHVDDKVIDNKAKINFIIGGSNSVVEWWKPRQSLHKEIEISDMETSYLKYEEHECYQVESANLVGLNVINAGQPHRVKNPNTHRICVSVPLFIPNSDVQIQFEQLMERL